MIYYYSKVLDDHDCYSIRAKRKKDVVEQLEELGLEKGECGAWFDSDGFLRFGEIKKAKVDRSKFEMLEIALSESGPLWEELDHKGNYE